MQRSNSARLTEEPGPAIPMSEGYYQDRLGSVREGDVDCCGGESVSVFK